MVPPSPPPSDPSPLRQVNPRQSLTNNLPSRDIVLTPLWRLVWTATLPAGGARESILAGFVDLLYGFGGVSCGGGASVSFSSLSYTRVLPPYRGDAPARLLLSSYARRGV